VRGSSGVKGRVSAGGAAVESRFGGEPLLAGVQWSVGVFWDVEAAKERGNQGNRVQGFSR